MTAVGFGPTTGGYLLYCEGLSLPVLLPESHVDLELTSVEPLNASIYPDREAALEDLAAWAPGSRHSKYAYYRAVGGALVIPTVISPATTPRIARTMLEVRKELAETVQRDLKVLLLNTTGIKLLSGVFSRVVQMGAGMAPRQLAGEPPAPRQPVPRLAPSPAAPLQPATAARPAPAPGALAPSPGLVQALTGKNPTRQVAPGTRLPQDVAVRPQVPRTLLTDRPVGSSATQNAQVQADIQYLERIGARNIRVNQQQVTQNNGQRVGVNRPDLQFDYRGRRYHVEYDTPVSGRGAPHQLRTTSNDPNSETILLIVP
ncbi:MAG TPA: hypothetical protein VLQ93_05850 [Myxococcaceae bacterium]|nr:hypothetical protein [Myxococcaceae bacterium]